MILASQFTLELKENLQQKVHNESNKRSHAPRQETAAQGAACSGNCLLPLIQAVVKGLTIFLARAYKNFEFLFLNPFVVRFLPAA
jgi:hypothetical protein